MTKTRHSPAEMGPGVYLQLEMTPASAGGAARVVRFNRRQALVAIGLSAVVCVWMVLGLVLAVPAAKALLDRREYDALISERARQGERLQTLIGALERVGDRSGELATRLGRVHIAYDLPRVEADDATAPGRGRTLDSIYGGLLARGTQETASTRADLGRLGNLLASIEAHEDLDLESVLTTPSVSPLGRATFVMTSPFGSRRNPFTHQLDLHAGVDLAAVTGTPILSPADGVVTFAGRYQLRVGVAWWRFGNLVALRHGDRFVTLYGHCDEVRVRRGQRVRRGDVLATVGNSGWSTNPHLHYEVRRVDADARYVPLDPRLFILDQSWRDEEQILARADQPPGDFERLPRSLRR